MEEKGKVTRILYEIKDLLKSQKQNQKTMLSFEEACDYLDLSASQLYKLTSSNFIEYYKPTGRKIYFKRDYLDQWMLRNPQKTVHDQIVEHEQLIRQRINKKAL